MLTMLAPREHDQSLLSGRRRRHDCKLDRLLCLGAAAAAAAARRMRDKSELDVVNRAVSMSLSRRC